MVLDPIPQSLPVHFFGSRPQPPTSQHAYHLVYIYNPHVYHIVKKTLQHTAQHCNTLQHTVKGHMSVNWVSLVSSTPVTQYKYTHILRSSISTYILNTRITYRGRMYVINLPFHRCMSLIWVSLFSSAPITQYMYIFNLYITYGVATISRLLKIIGLFCKI